MKNVLIIAPQNIFPPSDGGKSSIYQHILALANAGANVHLAMANTLSDTIKNYPEAKTCLDGILYLPRYAIEMKRVGKIGKLKAFGAWLFSGLPRQAQTITSAKNKTLVMDYIRDKTISVVVLEGIFVYELIDIAQLKSMGVRVVTIAHNVEQKYIDDALIKFGLLRKPEVYRTKCYEKKVLSTSDKVITISPADADDIKSLYELRNVLYLPTLIPTPCNSNWHGLNSDYIVFSGSLSFYPNYHGIKWFLENVWRKFSANSSLILKITGGINPKIRKELSVYKNVEFTGFLNDDDFSAVMNGARFIVVPIIKGSGVKMKLLEAMTMGIPTIGTKHCFEGIPFAGNEPYRLATDINEWLKAMTDLDKSVELRESLAKNGQAFISKVYASKDNVNNWVKMLLQGEDAV